MARRRFEMHHYRQALVRMRQGESDREIAGARLMGRRKLGEWRQLAAAHGWLDADVPLPDDERIATALGTPRRASSTISTLEPHRELLRSWAQQGVSGTAIHAALKRQHGWSGSYSAVRRLLADIHAKLPAEATCRLDFEPGDAAQVDFGAGPPLQHPSDPTGPMRRTWAFVMTLAHSRHQYVEFVWDQSVATWLGCHRRAFEWFGGVPSRLIIDNAKCAITKACAKDPTVQRAYAEAACGYGFKIDPCPPHDPQKKGIVESGVKYLKGNFLPLRSITAVGDTTAPVLSFAGLTQDVGRAVAVVPDGFLHPPRARHRRQGCIHVISPRWRPAPRGRRAGPRRHRRAGPRAQSILSMPRTTGTYAITTTLGESVHAFVPRSLPPIDPPLAPTSFVDLNREAELALARLAGCRAWFHRWTGCCTAPSARRRCSPPRSRAPRPR
jgi:transposase